MSGKFSSQSNSDSTFLPRIDNRLATNTITSTSRTFTTGRMPVPGYLGAEFGHPAYLPGCPGYPGTRNTPGRIPRMSRGNCQELLERRFRPY
eukprot:2811672-Rhodomonas_salina.5